MHLAAMEWNPLELPGPAFLLFYALVIAVAVMLTAWLRRWFEGGPAPRLAQNDPVQIAFLRGGPEEALRVALFGLLDRGTLALANGKVGPAEGGKPPQGEVENAVFQHFKTPSETRTLFNPDRIQWMRGRYEPELERLGLLPGPGDRTRRWLIAGLAALGLIVLAVTKIMIGLERNRPVEFLVIMGMGAPILAALPLFRRRTARGDAMVDDLKRIFSGIRPNHLEAGAPEAALAAAVYGLGFLPESTWAWRSAVFPKATSGDAGSTCSGGCGSSGCGGGGGGGGCGGCGGH